MQGCTDSCAAFFIGPIKCDKYLIIIDKCCICALFEPALLYVAYATLL